MSQKELNLNEQKTPLLFKTFMLAFAYSECIGTFISHRVKFLEGAETDAIPK